ncbi:hypothetical protein Btru_035756 [Bulinus truncatus]|nr:hypothetical protein Btru_035756 [Bulinus truncatus]
MNLSLYAICSPFDPMNVGLCAICSPFDPMNVGLCAICSPFDPMNIGLCAFCSPFDPMNIGLCAFCSPFDPMNVGLCAFCSHFDPMNVGLRAICSHFDPMNVGLCAICSHFDIMNAPLLVRHEGKSRDESHLAGSEPRHLQGFILDVLYGGCDVLNAENRTNFYAVANSESFTLIKYEDLLQFLGDMRVKECADFQIDAILKWCGAGDQQDRVTQTIRRQHVGSLMAAVNLRQASTQCLVGLLTNEMVLTNITAVTAVNRQAADNMMNPLTGN